MCTLPPQVLRAWQQLGGLHTVLLALLVAEVVVVQLGVLAWQLTLVRELREQHTRLFAAFLALPSAVMRSMASRWAAGLLGGATKPDCLSSARRRQSDTLRTDRIGCQSAHEGPYVGTFPRLPLQALPH